MNEIVYVDGRRLVLDPAHLIQSGGEGMVFEFGQDAIKRYHRPGPIQATKVNHLLRPEVRRRLPANVLAPEAIARDERGRFAGFQMKRLPSATFPLKKVTSAAFCQKQGLDGRHVIPLLREIHATMAILHQAGFVVGDLNDHNIFFTDPRRPKAGPAGTYTYWIDVDSFQIGPYPCVVADHTFLDPQLYPVKDFSRRPVFSPHTDWYAFFVLVVKCLLHVHPYGGVHHQHKSLASRAQARVTAFSAEIVYPKNAHPPPTLSDALLDYGEQVFGRGHREQFPVHLLVAYGDSLHRCSHCNLSYPQERKVCPGCQQTDERRRRGRAGMRLLLEVNGNIEYVAVQGQRITAVVRSEDQYRLVRAGVGGLLSESPLFRGRAGYRFGIFDETVVVNSVASGQLLLLDASRSTPTKVDILETDTFLDRAVFATTPTHLYRLAHGCVLKGNVRYGQYSDEIVATVPQRQTRIWGDPATDRVAGCYRIFDRHHFFLVNADGSNYDVKTNPPPGEDGSVKEMSACFGRERVAFLWETVQEGRHRHHGQIASGRGEPLYRCQPALTRVQGKMVAGDTLLIPADGEIRLQSAGGTSTFFRAPALAADDRLLPHSAGILVWQPSALHLLPT